MTQDNIAVPMRVLRADVPGGWLTNGTAYGQTVYLPANADASAWREITAAEYEAAVSPPETPPEPDTEKRLDAVEQTVSAMLGG